MHGIVGFFIMGNHVARQGAMGLQAAGHCPCEVMIAERGWCWVYGVACSGNILLRVRCEKAWVKLWGKWSHLMTIISFQHYCLWLAKSPPVVWAEWV